MVRQELQTIPGVGKSISEDFRQLGIHSVADLKGRSPEELYARLCTRKGVQVDRCMLYVMRCAVYYASETRPDPELLKWWVWKNREYRNGQVRPVTDGPTTRKKRAARR